MIVGNFIQSAAGWQSFFISVLSPIEVMLMVPASCTLQGQNFVLMQKGRNIGQAHMICKILCIISRDKIQKFSISLHW